MFRIIYIGTKSVKADNVAKTGLTWERGQIHEVEDDLKAAKLLEYPQVWANADEDYKLAEVPAADKPAPKPTVFIAPQGGEDISPYWEPVTIVVTGDVFKKLQNKEFVAVFMKPEDADDYEAYKSTKDVRPNTVHPSEMDKRSRAYKEWAAAHPDEAAKQA